VLLYFLLSKVLLVLLCFQLLEDPSVQTQDLDLNELSMEIFQELDFGKMSTDASSGVILFLLAFIGSLVNLPSFLLLETQCISLRIMWRYFGLGLIIAPWFLHDLLSASETVWRAIVDNIVEVFLMSLINTLYVYLVYTSVNYTYVVHTLLLCSIGTTFLAAWKIAKKSPYTVIEYIGIGINVLGVYLCFCEGNYTSRKFNLNLGTNLLKGDSIAILASAVYAIYIAHSRSFTKNKKCPITVYLGLLSCFTIALSFIISLIAKDPLEFFSFDPQYGIFGLFSSWREFKYGFFGLGIMAGYIYHYFTLRAQEKISPMFVNVCYNFTPFLSQLVAYLLSAQEEFPGVFTAFGGAILFIGCTLLAMNYQDQQEMAHIPLLGGKDSDLTAPEDSLKPVPLRSTRFDPY